MSLAVIAKALGVGVAIAALTPYQEWVDLLRSRESISDTVGGEANDFAVYELLAIQELDDFGEKVIEVRVLATDGQNQLKIYFYAKPGGAESAN